MKREKEGCINFGVSTLRANRPSEIKKRPVKSTDLLTIGEVRKRRTVLRFDKIIREL